MQVTRVFEFSAGHSLPTHPGKCKWLHGHNYRLEVSAEGPIDTVGMVIDFGDLKRAVQTVVIDPMDHHFFIWAEDPRCEGLLEIDEDSVIVVPWQPTAENLTCWFTQLIASVLPKLKIRCLLWETETSYAQD